MKILRAFKKPPRWPCFDLNSKKLMPILMEYLAQHSKRHLTVTQLILIRLYLQSPKNVVLVKFE